MSDSSLRLDSQNRVVGYYGPDATELFRAKNLKAFLSLYQKTKIIPTRGMGIKKMLAMAERYTGKKYTIHQINLAVQDVGIWIDAMIAAIPIDKDSN